MFTITEDDLETLEVACPNLYSALPPESLNRKDIQDHSAMIKRVLSDVRWNYAPHINVERIEP